MNLLINVSTRNQITAVSAVFLQAFEDAVEMNFLTFIVVKSLSTDLVRQEN